MITVSHLTKEYPLASSKIVALNDVSFTLAQGSSLAICGSSGSGKSTLLNILGGLDVPTTGDVIIHDQNIHSLSQKEGALFRAESLGFIFQFHHLLNDFNILENVMMPLLIQKKKRAYAEECAKDLLEKVGIADKQDRMVSELSGGEQQRAAIARALIHKPKLILADEPTGSLDDQNAFTVFDLLCKLNHDLEATLIMVTHHTDFAKQLHFTMELHKGSSVSWAARS